jgi:hypothetical protein
MGLPVVSSAATPMSPSGVVGESQGLSVFSNRWRAGDVCFWHEADFDVSR